MAAGKVYINGVDIRATYSADVFEMPDAPTPAMRTRVNREYGLFPRPKRVTQEFDGKTLTLRFNVQGTSNSNVQSNVAGISSLCGVQGGTVKPVTINILTSTSAGVDATGVTYVGILEDFTVDHIEPIHMQFAVYGTMRFAIIDIQSTAVTTQTVTIAANSGLSSNYYFADSNCVQGSTPMKIEMTCSTSANLYVRQMAVEPELLYSPLGYTKNGNVVIVDGQYGFPAASFAASGASLSYSANQVLALGGSMNGTIVIRMKRNYATNDATNKYLFQASSVPLSLHIAANSQDLVLTFPLSSGTSTITLAGSTISNTAWNTIIVHLNGPAIALYLTVGSTTTSVGNTGANPLANGTPGGSLYIGNSTVGSGLCKSYVSEFAIYSYNLTAGQLTELQTMAVPLCDSYTQDLNRNLLFLLDFSRGFYFKANRGHQILMLNQITSTERIVFDTQKQSLRRYTTTSGLNSEISGEIELARGYGSSFSAQRYNKFLLGCSSTGTTTYRFTYDARGRW